MEIVQNNGQQVEVFTGTQNTAPLAETQKIIDDVNSDVEIIVDGSETEVKKETPKPDVKDKKQQPKATEEKTKSPDKKEADKVSNEKESEKVADESLEISFDFDNKKPSKDVKKLKEETPNLLTEDVVVKYLKENGIEVSKVSDLSKKESLPKPVEEFLKFYNETGGRGHNDFMNSQKDWKLESKENAIREFYTHKHKNLSPEDIQRSLDLLLISDQEKDELSDREVNERTVALNKEYSNALEFLTDRTGKYSTNLDSPVAQKPPTAEEIAKAHKPYWEQRDKSLDEFSEIKMTIKDFGDIILSVEDTDRELISKNTETLDAFIGQWQNKDKSMNTEPLVRDMSWAIPKIRQGFLKKVIEQTRALTLQNLSDENRGVKLGAVKQTDENIKQDGLYVESGDNEGFSPKPIL